MPQLDLQPIEHAKSKPKGWRRLKMPDFDNPKDRWLPFLLFCACVAFLIGFFLNRDTMSPLWLFVGTVIMAFFAGGLFMWFTNRE